MIFSSIILLIIGGILIIKGGDWFVDAAAWIAEISRIPKFIVGATIVSIATTLPELIVSVMAAISGNSGMAVGNAVGSVTANIGLIMGVSFFAMPTTIKRSSLITKASIMLGACTLLFAFSFGRSFSIVGSVVLLAVFCLFIAENVISAKKAQDFDGDGEIEPSEVGNPNTVKKDKKTVTINIIKFIIGISAIIIGSDLVVDNAEIIAKYFGIPDAIIGATIVAIGTSLPELITTITAIVKKESSLSVGNIIGANIIDLTLIMPLCSFVSGGSLAISNQSAFLDIPACLLILGISMIPTMICQKATRWQGALLIISYSAYLALLMIFFL